MDKCKHEWFTSCSIEGVECLKCDCIANIDYILDIEKQLAKAHAKLDFAKPTITAMWYALGAVRDYYRDMDDVPEFMEQVEEAYQSPLPQDKE